jgi:hypothetical protein
MADESTLRRFRARLETEPDSQAIFVVIPFDVQQAFGSRSRVPVHGAINGHPFRGSLIPYGGKHYLGVNRALRESAGVRADDLVEVEIERDDEPRIVNPPADLIAALQANEAARSVWEKLSYSHQREYVAAIEEAKKPETRSRRIDKTIAALLAAAEQGTGKAGR